MRNKTNYWRLTSTSEDTKGKLKLWKGQKMNTENKIKHK